MKKFIPLILMLTILLSGCSSIHQHKYADANYQQPATCTICGKTQGFELKAEFETRELEPNMELNQEYEYKTICSKDESYETVAKAVVVSDEVIKSDETHPEETGYEYRTVTVNLTFNDYNSNEYGFKYNYFTTDYYNITGFTETYGYNEDKLVNEFKISFYGTEYNCTLNTSITKTDWKKNSAGLYTKVVTITMEFMLPENYDGIVIGLRNSNIDVTDTQFIYQYYNPEQFLLYRLEASHE